jgi:hypothetical protein
VLVSSLAKYAMCGLDRTAPKILNKSTHKCL